MNKHIETLLKAPLAMKLGVAAGFVCVVTALNAFFFIQPLEEDFENLQGQQRQLDQQLVEKKSIAKNLSERQKEMQQLEVQLKEALTELPENKDIDELLAQLTDVGRRSGLEISRVEPAAESVSGFYARIPINITVRGNYHEIAMFLQEISNLRRIVNVSQISLDAPDVKNDKVLLATKFVATTFRFVESAQPKSPGDNG